MLRSLVGNIHSKLVFNRRTLAITNFLTPRMISGLVLDVGCGNGIIGHTLNERRKDIFVVGVDVLLRPKMFIPVIQYDGFILPFDNHSFSTVILIDVLHHTSEPEVILKECARVSRQNILVKDHFSETIVDLSLLKILDWVGNNPHGVALPYNYFSRKKWNTLWSSINLMEKERYEEIPELYPPFFQSIIGKNIQFISMLVKKGDQS